MDGRRATCGAESSRLLLFFAQPEYEALGPNACGVELLVEQVEQRDRDRRLLHAKEPLDVGVAAAHAQSPDADLSGDPGRRRVVVEKELFRVAVDPLAEQMRRDDDVNRRAGDDGNCDPRGNEDHPKPLRQAFDHDVRAFLARDAPIDRVPDSRFQDAGR